MVYLIGSSQRETTGIVDKGWGKLCSLSAGMLETASSNCLNTTLALGLLSHWGSNIPLATECNSGTSYPANAPAFNINMPNAHTSMAYGEVGYPFSTSGGTSAALGR